VVGLIEMERTVKSVMVGFFGTLFILVRHWSLLGIQVQGLVLDGKIGVGAQLYHRDQVCLHRVRVPRSSPYLNFFGTLQS